MQEVFESKFPQETLTFIKQQSWAEVQERWKEDESGQTDFAGMHTELGYASWEEWRKKIVGPLQLDQLYWSLYQVREPLEAVPMFRGGPFINWINRYYNDKELPTFAEVVKQPNSDIPDRDKFKEILEHCSTMQLIGIVKDEDIFIVEGMHRCAAVALAAARKQTLDIDVSISLAETSLSQLPTIY